MFKVTDQPQFTHPVDVLVPTDSGHETQTFKATFKVLPADEDQDQKFDLSTVTGSTSFLKEVLISMSDLVDAHDQPMTYSEGLRDRLLKVPYIRAALARTYYAAINKAAVGN
jgi:hypothetical protein